MSCCCNKSCNRGLPALAAFQGTPADGIAVLGRRRAVASGGVLPDWPAGTVAILATGGPAPHAIPVSTALRAGPRAIVLALAAGRESLARLRADPSVAVVIVGARNVALTAYGTAQPLEAPTPDGVVAVRVLVERVQDHRQPAFVIESGVRWRWTDVGARERDAQVRTTLARIASQTSDG